MTSIKQRDLDEWVSSRLMKQRIKADPNLGPIYQTIRETLRHNPRPDIERRPAQAWVKDYRDTIDGWFAELEGGMSPTHDVYRIDIWYEGEPYLLMVEHFEADPERELRALIEYLMESGR